VNLLQKTKILLVTETPPGTPNGFGVTLNSILGNRMKNTLVIFTDGAFRDAEIGFTSVFAQVPNHRGRRHWFKFMTGLSPEWRGQYSDRWLKRSLPHGSYDIVYSMTYSFSCMRFANWISRTLQIPHIIHIADHSLELFSSREALDIIEKAPVRIVIGENMRTHYQSHFPGLDFSVLHHGPEEGDFLSSPTHLGFSEKRPMRVRFIGGLFENLHADCIEDIISSIRKLHADGFPVTLECYGARHPANFPDGLTDMPEIQHHGIIMPLDRKRQIVEEADVCIVPASFDPKKSSMYMYSLPTKLTELLASGRPTLIYGPKDMESISFCRREGLGCILDKRSINDLVELFADMIGNYQNYVQNARKDAEAIRKNYSAKVVRTKFENVLEVALKNGFAA